jgi:hypothetical protein
MKNDWEPIEKFTPLQLIANGIRNGLMYAIVEVVFLLLFLVGRLTGDGLIWPPLLWLGFTLAAVWTLTTMSDESHLEAKEYVLNRELFLSDFIVSAVLLCLMAVVVLPQGWQFSTMFLFAAGQNLRYTYESTRWLAEEKHASERRRQDNSDNNLPGV